MSFSAHTGDDQRLGDGSSARLMELVARQQYRLSVNAPRVGAALSGRSVTAGSEGKLVSDVADALECGDWAFMRHLVSNAALETIIASEALGILMAHDHVLRRRLADASNEVADQFEQFGMGARLSGLDWQLALGNPEAGSRRVAACLIRDRMPIPLDLVCTAAMLIADSSYQAEVVVDLLGRLDEFGQMSDKALETGMQGLWKMLCHQGQTEMIGTALLRQRPATVIATNLLLKISFDYIDEQRWQPDARQVLDLMRWLQSESERNGDWSAIPPDRRLIALLDGLADQYSGQDMSRPAALLSLCRILLEPELMSIARGVFESNRVSDGPLLSAVLDASAGRWMQRPVESGQADFFHASILPAIGRLAHRADQRPLQQLLALGDSCYRSIEGSPGGHSADYDRTRREIADGTFTYASDDVFEMRSMQFMAEALWGCDSPDILSTPLIDDAEPLFDGARWQLHSRDVLRYAHAASFERGRGPSAMLVVVDCAIESGDLLYARELMEDLLRYYPENSMVYEWLHKIAGHTSNEPKEREAIDNIRRLWRDGADTATPIAQIGVMERMWDIKALQEAIRDRVNSVLDHPEFKENRDRLERLTRG